MKPTRDQIRADIEEILQGMISNWGVEDDEIGAETHVIADLGFSSVDLIHLMASIEMRFHRKLPYDEIIMKDGQYAEDVSVAELVDFVARNIDRPVPDPQAM